MCLPTLVPLPLPDPLLAGNPITGGQYNYQFAENTEALRRDQVLRVDWNWRPGTHRRRAMDRRQPARVGYGAGVSYFNVNRDAIHPDTKRWYQGPNLTGESDKTLAVLSFVAPDGKPIALFVNYAMHPISFYLRGIVSADFPGDASRYIESVYGDDVVVVWSQGAEGDQNPLYSRPSGAVCCTPRRGTARRHRTCRGCARSLDQGDGRRARRRDYPRDEWHNASKRPGADLGRTGTVTCPGRTRLDKRARAYPANTKTALP